MVECGVLSAEMSSVKGRFLGLDLQISNFWQSSDSQE
jgi:hypothetical protein